MKLRCTCRSSLYRSWRTSTEKTLCEIRTDRKIRKQWYILVVEVGASGLDALAYPRVEARTESAPHQVFLEHLAHQVQAASSPFASAASYVEFPQALVVQAGDLVT